MHRYCVTARQLGGIRVHLSSGHRARFNPAITGSWRAIAALRLAAVLVLAVVTSLPTIGPATAVAIARRDASAVSPMAMGQGQELTARRVPLGCRPWRPYR